MWSKALPSPRDDRDYPASAALDMSAAAELPAEFEVWQPPVENQGSVGNCVAQAVANIMECIAHNYGEDHRDYSVGYVYGMSTASGAGMNMREACAVLVKEGDVLRSVWECLEENPDCRNKRQTVGEDIKAQARKTLAYVRLQTAEEAKAFIYKYKLPILISAPTTAFMFGGGYHAVAVYGWDTQAFKYTNSWGTGGFFGDGRGKIQFEKITELWGIIPMEKVKLTDIEESWAKDDIQYLADRGIVTGYEDNTYRPKQAITREEMAAMIARAVRHLSK